MKEPSIDVECARKPFGVTVAFAGLDIHTDAARGAAFRGLKGVRL
jgi:hypothetical protein